MKKMKTLKIFDRPILNFIDLHNEFSPGELFLQIDSLIDFVEVHCLPLQSHIRNKDGNVYPAVYLTKNFWLEILRRKEWPSGKTFEEILYKIFNEISNNDPDTNNEEINKEIIDSRIIEKLRFISQNSGQNSRNIIMLLAMAELAEIDSTKIDPSQWKISSGNVNNLHDEIMQLICDNDTLKLTASGQVYKYYYYDGENLPDNSEIRTVKIQAIGSNQFAEVKIELYSKSLKCCIQKLNLKLGEYIYCNVADGKIIKFLPNISINQERCLIRYDYTKSDITVFTKGAEEWTLNSENVSSFTVGMKHDGFLIIQNGKINYSFYEPAQDYFERLKLDMIALPVVEALITEDGYEFLLSDGTIKSNHSHLKNNKKVSLNSAGRYPFPEIQGLNHYKDAAIYHDNAAIITNNSEKKFYVQFSGENNGLKISERKIILLNGGL